MQPISEPINQAKNHRLSCIFNRVSYQFSQLQVYLYDLEAEDAISRNGCCCCPKDFTFTCIYNVLDISVATKP